MIGWFVHGWGSDASVWSRLVPRLPRLRSRLADRGYFGGKGEGPPDEPAIWITHSLGTMLALKTISPQCRAMVAINGFDRFTSGDGAQGVDPRVLDLMLSRLDEDPDAVVGAFRASCGATAPVARIEPEALRRDLVVLREGDCRVQAAALAVPVLCLHSAEDQVLPPAMVASTLRSVPHAQHETHPDAGHVLPLEDPDWCAERIHAFIEDLA